MSLFKFAKLKKELLSARMTIRRYEKLQSKYIAIQNENYDLRRMIQDFDNRISELREENSFLRQVRYKEESAVEQIAKSMIKMLERE